MHAQVVPEMVSRVHTLLPQSYDWSGGDGKPGASEDKRERAEVQRAYYGFLNALAQNQLLQCLQVPTICFMQKAKDLTDRPCLSSSCVMI